MAVNLLAGQIVEGETKKAVLACNDYLRMGISRSLEKLCRTYAEIGPKEVPTKHLNVLKGWSAKFGWQARAEAYDKAIDAEKTALAEARRRRVMESGLALDYARVEELSELFAALKREFIENGLWYTDTKLSATGMTVAVEVFNKPLIDSFRATLDDLAKETGGRKQRVDMEHGGEITTKVIEGPRDVR